MIATHKRNLELRLLILGLLAGLAALSLGALARSTERLSLAIPLLTAVAAGYVVTHFFLRRWTSLADPLLLPTVCVLNAIGLAAVYSLDPRKFGPTQVLWTIIGLGFVIGTLLLVRDYRMLARYKYIFGFAGVGLLLLPLSPIGQEINGAQLWVRLGSFSFQPGEAAKICLVIFFAAYLSERKELLSIASYRIAGLNIPEPKHLGPVLVMWLLSLAVMFYEKDLGSSLLFFSIFVLILYIATARVFYLAAGGVLFLLGAVLGYSAFSHVQSRVEVWLDVFDPKLIDGPSYQMAQSLFALATGGLFGTGWGQGRPDLIPEAHTDFIFAAIGEQLGLFGTGALLILFMLIVARGFRAAVAARDDFGQLLAAGLVSIFAIQSIIIMAGVTRLLPLTGITLPFVSYGGSSLLANFVLIALLLRISHQTAAAPAPAHTGEIMIGGKT